jgi:C1A family cysteine protease
MKVITGVTIIGAILLALSCFNYNFNSSRDLSANGMNPIKLAFSKWLIEHGVKFTTPQEFNYRFRVFAKTHAKIEAENNKKLSYTLGHNKFSVLTEEEFIAKYTGLKVPENYERNIVSFDNEGVNADVVDWRAQGAVNAVKDQGQCGSCWAFSAVASIEGAWKISGHALENLAEQQLVDCSTSFGNHGCNGGWMDYGFKYVITSGGLERTADYPYKAVDQACKFSASKVAGKITGFADVPKNDCKTLLTFAAQGPTSVAIAANAIMNYRSGVFSNASCGTGLNHGVTLVGYGHDDKENKDYYTVRNSWGSGWGEQGYIRMDRGVQTSSGICGICMAASIAQFK